MSTSTHSQSQKKLILVIGATGLGEELTWSQVTTGPYMETLNAGLFGPLNVREDGTVVFAAPLEDGHVPLIALKDLGWRATRSTTARRPPGAISSTSIRGMEGEGQDSTDRLRTGRRDDGQKRRDGEMGGGGASV
ncbi:hypothetical protein B0H14DRAFT_3515398 [Mycena olivaceomarginata]|nr:hypothetical protein B0H14DRAFT_3515398 [Mycena olivaceomarginata]